MKLIDSDLNYLQSVIKDIKVLDSNAFDAPSDTIIEYNKVINALSELTLPSHTASINKLNNFSEFQKLNQHDVDTLKEKKYHI